MSDHPEAVHVWDLNRKHRTVLRLKPAMDATISGYTTCCGGGSSFTGDHGKYVNKVSRYGHLSPLEPPFHLRGTWYVGEARILGTLINE